MKVKLVTGGPDLLPDCSNYNKDAYPKACNTVDTAILRMRRGSLCVLLVKRGFEPFKGSWALPGGFVDLSKNETLVEAAYRETKEETKAEGFTVIPLGTYGDPGRDPRDRVISTVFYSLLRPDTIDEGKLEAGDDAVEYKWSDLSKIEKENLGFDHLTILQDLRGELKAKAQYSPIAFSLVPEDFTWSDIQEAYSALLGKNVANIRRKLNNRYVIEVLGTLETGSATRPPRILKYKGEKDAL